MLATGSHFWSKGLKEKSSLEMNDYSVRSEIPPQHPRWVSLMSCISSMLRREVLYPE